MTQEVQSVPRRVEAAEARDLKPLPEMFDESILQDPVANEFAVSPENFGDHGLNIAHTRAEEALAAVKESLDWFEKRRPGVRQRHDRAIREIGSLLDDIETMQESDADLHQRTLDRSPNGR